MCHCFHFSTILLPWSDGTRCHDLSFLNFKPTFSLSCFTLIKRLFSSSLLSAIRVVSCAYQRLLIFLLAVLIPVSDSSNPAFLMMYSAYKLSKVLVAQWCPTFCELMDCSPPGSFLRETLQARILEWVTIPFSRGSFWPKDWTRVSCITGRFFTIWATGVS